MGRKQNNQGQSVNCSVCNERTYMFVCLREVQEDGTLTEPEVFCSSCRANGDKLERAETAVRTMDWEW